MAHVSDKKKKIVAKIEAALKEYPVIGIANLEGVPGSQLSKIREKLREHMFIFMAKKTLMSIVFKGLEKDKKGVSSLIDYFEGLPCLILTKEAPFKVANLLQKNRTSAPAKVGQKAPNDIVVPAGPTPFSPGPIIGELSVLGIKSAVENGKIVIKEDKVIAKEGDEISANVASLLTRLGIEPMEIGIQIIAAYEDGVIFKKDVLTIDESVYLDQVSSAGAEALNLTLAIGYITPDNIEQLLIKANQQARTLALEQNILTKDTVKEILAKANGHCSSIKALIKEE